MFCSIIICFSIVTSTKTCFAQEAGTIYIRADGSIDPQTAPISTPDNVTYTLTGDILNDSIVIERDNIVIDGAGYTLQGTNAYESKGTDLTGRTNVTIENTNIKNYTYGIYLSHTHDWPYNGSNHDSIFGNNITDNGYGICLTYSSDTNIFGNRIEANDLYGIRLGFSSGNTISGNNIANNGGGIHLDYSSDNSISGNNITSNTSLGISLTESSNHNSIFGNNITNNAGGITLSSSSSIDSCSNNSIVGNSITNNDSGIYLEYASDNEIFGNDITANNFWGIQLLSSSFNDISGNNVRANNESGILIFGFGSHYSLNNSVVGNNITANNQSGIQFYYSSYNIIFGNTIRDNENGILTHDSNNNTIYCNNFMDNYQVSVSNSTDYWDKDLEGNYWSDYNRTDSNQDGLGDTPYVIDENNTDHYPLMYPYGSIQNVNTSLIYLTIQQAINADATLDGHVIHVESGTYNLIYTLINKSVSLLGEGMENTKIIGSQVFPYDVPIFDVGSDNVTISGFTLTEGYTAVDIMADYTHITNCNISYNIRGIDASFIYELFGAVTIDGNIIANNIGNGIHLSTWSNVISNNVIFGNSLGGIVLDCTGTPTNSTQVYGNVIENNQRGVVIGFSYNNTLFHNDFVNNTVQVDVWGTPPYVGNDWAENYWSDYNGTGDTPYVIDANNQDPYPLMTPYVIPEFPSFLILPLFFLATLLAVITYRRKHFYSAER